MAPFQELSLLVLNHTSGKTIAIDIDGGMLIIDKRQLAEIVKGARLKLYARNKYSFGTTNHYKFKPKS